MNISLTFNDITFSPVPHQNSLWIRAVELARALGYSSEEKVSRVYRRNADEFTPDMTQLIEISAEAQNGLLDNLSAGRCRIFSLRGCHLLAMFARTPVAKAFRRWVLDVLDRLAAQERAALPEVPHIAITPSTTASRKPLEKLVKVWAARGGIIVAQCWTMVNAAFNLQSITELPEEWIPDALEWVQGKIDNLTPALPAPDPTPAPTQATVVADAPIFRESYPADMGTDRKEAMQRIERIAREMHSSFGVVRNIVRLGCHPGGKTMRMSLDEREAYEILHNLYVAADESLCAAYNALDAGYKLGRLYGRG